MLLRILLAAGLGLPGPAGPEAGFRHDGARRLLGVRFTSRSAEAEIAIGYR